MLSLFLVLSEGRKSLIDGLAQKMAVILKGSAGGHISTASDPARRSPTVLIAFITFFGRGRDGV